MAKIQSVWAIDIGQAALKALKLVPGDEPGKVTAEAFDYVEYPKILSQPDAEPEELVREALSTFLERNVLKGSKVAIAVSGQAGLVKFVKLPPVEKSRIPDVVKFEARQQIPFALEEVIWDYQKIGETDGGEADDFEMVEIGLFAMKRDQINRAILPLKTAGIEVDFVQMAPIALYNFVAFDNPPPQENGPEQPTSYVVLDIGVDNTNLIITDGTRIWQRNVPIGGNHFTRALTKELKQTFAKAEHLKRNATKAQDPRAVFSAMRGVFSDFSNEVNRSIGFYSSVNREAKIAQIVGIGNGFKLPGLLKFIQQNVNFDVQRLEHFEKLSGEEVVNSPQFQENLSSFAVAYGLGLQGLGLAKLKTNLLPPEVEQVRMIRRKKPWALAASTLLMLGFSAMFASAWASLQKTKPLLGPAGDAKQVADQGTKYQSDFDSAKAEFNKIKGGGETLVDDSAETESWPALLQTTLGALPNPPVELAQKDPGFDPADPVNAPIIGMLRVHIDKFVPVFREDLGAEWYDTINNQWKETMHPLDRDKGPSGPGWVVQLVGHHFNPSKNFNPSPSKNPKSSTDSQKDSKESVGLTARQKIYAEGPLKYLRDVVMPRFSAPAMRLFGIHHATLTWYYSDAKWTTDKGAKGVPVPPLREKAVASAAGASSESQMQMQMQGGGTAGMMGKMGGGDGPGSLGGGMMGGGMGAASKMRGGMAGMPGPPSGDSPEKKISYLTRTDFIIEFVWQPLKRAEAPKTEEEYTAKLDEIKKSLKDAEEKIKGSVQAGEVDESKLRDLSLNQSEKALEQAAQKLGAAGNNAGPGDGSGGPQASPDGGSPTTGNTPANQP